MNDSSISERTERRMAILAAAQAVFAEYGFHKAKVETIAERASVAKGTIYLYFSSKNELLRALVSERMARLLHLVDEQIDRERDFAAMVEAVFLVHFLFYFEEREFIAILYGQLGQIAEGMEGPAKRGWEEMTGLIAQLLQEGVQKGLLRSFCVRTLAQALQGMIHAVAFDWIVTNGQETPQELASQTYQLFRLGAFTPENR